MNFEALADKNPLGASQYLESLLADLKEKSGVTEEQERVINASIAGYKKLHHARVQAKKAILDERRKEKARARKARRQSRRG